MQVPVLLLGFNRAESLRKVLGQVRLARPERLFFAVDGPRPGRPEEARQVDQVKDLVREVDWPCEVVTRFSLTNQGCRVAVSSAISWFFSHVEEGIILEDDCVPDPSFFVFCEQLLQRYRNDPRIVHIGGFNAQEGLKRGEYSYYFSRYFHVWGWATWRRAWAEYDLTMEDFPRFSQENAIRRVFRNPILQQFWMGNFRQVYENQLDTWDYQWVFTNLSRGRLAIVPNVNLVQNVGFGPGATHTLDAADPVAKIGSESITVDEGPRFVLPDEEADEYTYTHHLGHDLNPPPPPRQSPLWVALKSVAKRFLGRA